MRKGRERNELRQEGEWLRLDAPELRLVPEDLWHQVQARREARREAIPRNPATRQADMARRAFRLPLARARHPRPVRGQHPNLDKYGRRPRRYRCASTPVPEHENREPAVCGNDTRLRQEILDHAVLEALSGLWASKMVDADAERAVARLRAGPADDLDRRGRPERELWRSWSIVFSGRSTPTSPAKGLMEEARGRLVADKGRKQALVAELERLDA